jgi:hypothetical protein
MAMAEGVMMNKIVDAGGDNTDNSKFFFPSSVMVKNEWSYTSTPPIRLHGMVLS